MLRFRLSTIGWGELTNPNNSAVRQPENPAVIDDHTAGFCRQNIPLCSTLLPVLSVIGIVREVL